MLGKPERHSRAYETIEKPRRKPQIDLRFIFTTIVVSEDKIYAMVVDFAFWLSSLSFLHVAFKQLFSTT